MSRSPATVQAEMLALSPPGYARAPSSFWAAILLPAATEASLIEQTAEDLHAEIDPRRSILLIPEWEALFGTDPFGVNYSSLTESALQAYLYSRLVSSGGQSVEFYENLAAAYGISITVELSPQTVYGGAIYGADVYSQTPNQFQWLVTLPADLEGTNHPLILQLQTLEPAETLLTITYQDS